MTLVWKGSLGSLLEIIVIKLAVEKVEISGWNQWIEKLSLCLVGGHGKAIVVQTKQIKIFKPFYLAVKNTKKTQQFFNL